jgi:AraC-like DNA-binding protein
MKVPAKAFAPRSEQYINFYIRGGEWLSFDGDSKPIYRSSACMTGQYTRVFQRRPTSEFLMIQVPFHTGALYQLTGVPFYELRDGFVNLDVLFPVETREVDDQLREAHSYSQMIDIVDAFLVGLFRSRMNEPNRPFDKMLRHVGHSLSLQRIDDLANQACVSTRQFERLSRSYFGVGPKMMTRITRFSSTYIMRSRHPLMPWLDIALACGYEDYQHMVRDYKEIGDITPTQLWALDLKGPERILGLR